MDKWFERAAHLSQIGLLTLGVFGYFYTVVPVFQNQQLQEQAAKLELEKAEEEKKLASLFEQQSKVSENIHNLQKKLEAEKEHSTKLASEMLQSKSRESKARNQAVAVEIKLQRELKLIDSARWELVLLDFQMAYFWPHLQSAFKNEDSGKKHGDFILDAKKEWPKPYIELLSAIDTISKSNKKTKMPDSYYIELREFVIKREATLQCNPPNLDVLYDEYIKERATLEPLIDTELADYINKIKSEYASKAQRVEITDEFRSASRRPIKVSHESSVEAKYRDKLLELKKSCDQKSEAVISEIRNIKGATR